MVFCDVKPDNICMDLDERTNKPESFALIDFQMVQHYPDAPKCEFGTRLYRPSEMQKYKSYPVLVTEKWDIYGLGITLIELMNGTGYHPYGDKFKDWKHNIELSDVADIQSKVYKDYLNLFVDQEVIDEAIANCDVLKEDRNSDLKDLIQNMTRDNFMKRYDCDDIINHRWYKRHCL